MKYRFEQKNQTSPSKKKENLKANNILKETMNLK